MFDFENVLIAEFRKAFSEGKISECGHMVKAFPQYEEFISQAYFHRREQLKSEGYKLDDSGRKYYAFYLDYYYTTDYHTEFYDMKRTDKEAIELVQKYMEDGNFSEFEEHFERHLVSIGWDELYLPYLCSEQGWNVEAFDIWEDFRIDVFEDLKEETLLSCSI